MEIQKNLCKGCELFRGGYVWWSRFVGAGLVRHILGTSLPLLALSLTWSTETTNLSLMNLTASFSANLYPLMILVGWTLFMTSSFPRFKSSAATITTEV